MTAPTRLACPFFPLRVRLAIIRLTAMGCAIWLAMCGSGQVAAIMKIATLKIALSAAAVGSPSTTTVLSRAGPTSARAACTVPQDFVSVVESFFARSFRYTLHLSEARKLLLLTLTTVILKKKR
jgi:hypothetical protein